MQRQAAKNLRAGNRKRRLVRACGWLAAGVLLGSAIQAADSPPENVFAWPPVLPPELKRVAVLPLTAKGPEDSLPDGCEALAPALLDELVRTEKFEVAAVRPENLRASSGRQAWTGTERLPKDFFDSLRREYNCDAVLFCELTVYHAYAPLAIGWRLKLVDARTHKILWAADEVFDGSRSEVTQKARLFWLKRDASAEKNDLRWQLANSPRQFGRYTAAAVLATLPVR